MLNFVIVIHYCIDIRILLCRIFILIFQFEEIGMPPYLNLSMKY